MHRLTERLNGMSAYGFEKLEFTIGGFFGGWCELTIERNDGGAFEWSASHSEERLSRRERRGKLCQKDEAGLFRCIDEADVFNWYRFYHDPDICDGTSWSIQISSKARIIFESEGINSYPKGFDRLIEGLGRCGLPQCEAEACYAE